MHKINLQVFKTVPTASRNFSQILSSQRRFLSTSRSLNSLNAAPHIGFAGIGNMGGFMANNLLKAGYSLSVFDVSTEAVKQLSNRTNQSFSVVSSVDDLASCDVVITMLPNSSIVKDVYLNKILKNPLFKNSSSRTNKLFIDSSTIDPQSSIEVAKAAAQAGVEMVDAPVSGGVGGAEQGTLTFMVGGSDFAFSLANPFLSKMGKNIVHCGNNGNGQVAKISNNLVLAISMAAVSEGMNLGISLGMDPKKLASIINTSSGRCWSSEIYNPVPGVVPTAPASRSYLNGFQSVLMRKDLGLAIEASQNGKFPVPLSQTVKRFYDQICETEYKDKDFSVIYQYLKNQNKP